MNYPIGAVLGGSAVDGAAVRAAQRDRGFCHSGGAAAHPPAASGHAFPIEELALRHLRTSREIEKILYLREAIDLSVHTRAHSDFVALEKKETSAALSAHLNCAGKS